MKIITSRLFNIFCISFLFLTINFTGFSNGLSFVTHAQAQQKKKVVKKTIKKKVTIDKKTAR